VDIKKSIKDAIKNDRVILGYDRTIKEIKTKKPKMVVYANNIPKNRLKNIIHNTKLTEIDTEEYPGDNVSLGLICGKPFSVSILVIKGNEK